MEVESVARRVVVWAAMRGEARAMERAGLLAQAKEEAREPE